MTIQAESYRKDYTSTGGTTYPYTWRIQDDSWLAVYVDDVLQASGYSVTGVGDGSGGDVEFTTAPTAGAHVVIVPAVPMTQLTDYVEHDKFPAQTHEDALDKLTLIAQQQQEHFERSLAFTTPSAYRNAVVNTPVIGSYLRWSATSPPTVEATTVTPDTGIGLPLSQVDGGIGEDISAKTGALHQYAGTFAWESGTAFVDAFGAVGDGVTDDSAAIQAAIDSNLPRLVFNPDGVYYIETALAVALIASDTRREIDGQGCTILCGGSIANAFILSAPTGTDQFNRTRLHDFLFSGTVTGAYVKMETGATYWNDFWNLETTGNGVAVADALLEFHNTSATSNPGGFTVFNIKAPSNTVEHTVHFSKEAAALGDFDDFHLDWLQGGDDSTVEIEDGCTVVQSSIRNVLSDSHGIRTVSTGTFQNGHIGRIYVEPSITPSYGTTGTFIGVQIEDVRAWMAQAFVDASALDYTVQNQFKAAYGTYTDCSFRNCGMWATDAAGPPWALATYRFFDVLAGGNVVFEFPAKYAQNAILTETSSSVYPVSFVAEPVPLIQNTSDTLQSWMCYNSIITNYGQGVAATITLPAAKAGMRFTVIIQATGQTYHLKPNASDKVYLDGTALDDADKVSNATTVRGDCIRFETFVSGYTSGTDYDYDWLATTVSGTWTDGGA